MFSSHTIKLDLVYEYVKKLVINTVEFSLYKILFDNHQELMNLIDTREFDKRTGDCFKRFLLHFIKDKRTYNINKKVFTLRTVFQNFISSINENTYVNMNYDDMMYYAHQNQEVSISPLKECFLKNFFFNLLSQFHEYLNLPFDNFAISYWYDYIILNNY